MGRLMLNVLLSFAQFEREVIGERIRDKFAASRKKGMWMGGWAPLGYDVKDRKLVINESEAAACPVDLRAICEDGLGHEAGAGTRRRGRRRQARQAHRQGRRSTSSSTTASTSARRCTRARAIPASTRRSSTAVLWDKAHAVLKQNPKRRAGADPRADAGAAEGPDLRAGRLAQCRRPTPGGGRSSTATTSARPR